MSKKHFRLIAYLIGISLIGLIVLQVLWLTQMYSGMNEEFSQKVNSAMDRAAYEELSSRMNNDSNSNANFVSHEKFRLPSCEKDTTMITKNSDGSIMTSTIHQTIVTSLMGKTKQIDSIDNILPKDIRSITVIKDKTSEELNYSYMTLFLSIYSDSNPPIDLNLYDSLLTNNLINSNIYTEYQLSVINTDTDSTLQAIGLTPSSPLLFDIPLDKNSKYICQLAIENPNLSFLKEMSGIIISSILILSLILFSFIYLLRTIFRQKTLEEIRNDFTHNITHELKTPIATAYAANDALINFSADKSPLRREKYLEIVNAQLLKLSNMVERILSIASQETLAISIDPKEYLVSDIFKEVVSSFDIDSSKSIHLDIIPSELTITGDYFHITNLLNNLVDNALKYSDENVQIEITAYQENTFTILKIKDNGIGISSADQKRIFEKYYRVPTGNIHNVKGVGLGLYYTKLIIERHKGSITIESKLAQGSCFTIKLPNSQTAEVSK